MCEGFNKQLLKNIWIFTFRVTSRSTHTISYPNVKERRKVRTWGRSGVGKFLVIWNIQIQIQGEEVGSANFWLASSRGAAPPNSVQQKVAKH